MLFWRRPDLLQWTTTSTGGHDFTAFNLSLPVARDGNCLHRLVAAALEARVDEEAGSLGGTFLSPVSSSVNDDLDCFVMDCWGLHPTRISTPAFRLFPPACIGSLQRWTVSLVEMAACPVFQGHLRRRRFNCSERLVLKELATTDGPRECGMFMRNSCRWSRRET